MTADEFKRPGASWALSFSGAPGHHARRPDHRPMITREDRATVGLLRTQERINLDADV